MNTRRYPSALVLVVPIILGAARCTPSVNITPTQATYEVDPTLTATVGAIPPTAANPSRHLEAMADGKGSIVLFVNNELLVKSSNTQAIKSIEDNYGGKMIQPTDIPVVAGLKIKNKLSSRRYVVMKVDTGRLKPGQFQTSLARLNLTDHLRVSSENAASLLSIAADSSGSGDISINAVLSPTQKYSFTTTPEHPLDSGVNRQTGQMTWMSDSATDPTSLNIGVVRAWAYLQYHNLPPKNGTYQPAIVALLDGGFALDDQGLP